MGNQCCNSEQSSPAVASESGAVLTTNEEVLLQGARLQSAPVETKEKADARAAEAETKPEAIPKRIARKGTGHVVLTEEEREGVSFDQSVQDVGTDLQASKVAAGEDAEPLTLKPSLKHRKPTGFLASVGEEEEPEKKAEGEKSGWNLRFRTRKDGR